MYEKEIVSTVINCVTLALSYVTNNKKLTNDDIKSLRSRARDLPALLLTRGFPYVVVYIASRSSYEVFEKGLASSKCEEVIDGVINLKSEGGKEKLKGEEVGYALYGALLSYVMKSAKMIPEEKKTFKDLIEYSLNRPSLNVRASIVAEWIKRVVEAYT